MAGKSVYDQTLWDDKLDATHTRVEVDDLLIDWGERKDNNYPTIAAFVGLGDAWMRDDNTWKPEHTEKLKLLLGPNGHTVYKVWQARRNKWWRRLLRWFGWIGC